jgi:hypothetical protein
MTDNNDAPSTGSTGGRRKPSTGSTRRKSSKTDITRSRKRNTRTPEVGNIKPAQVRKLAEMQATNREIAAFFGITEGVLTRHFEAELIAGRDAGRASLRRMQWNSAKKGSVAMLIWLGKQYLNQSDAPANGDDGNIDTPNALRDLLAEMVQNTLGEPTVAGDPAVVSEPGAS